MEFQWYALGSRRAGSCPFSILLAGWRGAGRPDAMEFQWHALGSHAPDHVALDTNGGAGRPDAMEFQWHALGSRRARSCRIRS